VSALDEAQEAQMKAEEAIKKAHDDISAAEKDLAQVYMNVRMHVCACMHGWMVGRICFHV
jgi:hypothetical protein